MDGISLQEHCDQIKETIERGFYSEAVAHAKYVLEQYPKHLQSYRLLGKAMLEARQHDHAADMFLRVLSADPEDLFACVGLSEVHGGEGKIEAALWYMERAYELASDNQVIEDELRQLYGRRDGAEPERVQLTRGALARLYLKGDLLSRAISELHALLDEHPDRSDLQVALAEALWRNEQRLEASEVCQELLDRLPYCLKANLILGEIWTTSGREEGQTCLRRAEAIDPENRTAQGLLGDRSPLLAQEVRIAPFEHKPRSAEERPSWIPGVTEAEGAPATGAGTLFDIAAALEAQIEIPPWLEEVEIGEGGAPEAPVSEPLGAPVAGAPAAAQMGETPEWLEGAAGEGVDAGAQPGQAPEWLAGTDEGIGREGEAEGLERLASAREGATGGEGAQVPDWMTGVGEESAGQEPEAVAGVGEEAGVEEEVPEWLTGMGREEIGQGEAPAEGAGEGAPEWVTDLETQTVGGEVPPVPSSEGGPPEWLDGLREQFTAGTQPVGEIPQPERAPPTPAPAENSAAGETPLPEWLQGEEMPSGDEALAWLEGLAAGKEEELSAQADAEAEARVAELMGRAGAAEQPVEAAVAGEPSPAVAAPEPAEIPGWLQELAPSETAVPTPAAPPAEAASPVGVGAPQVPDLEAPAGEEAPLPTWLESEGTPSGDEALSWLEELAAGKEEELAAQTQAEAEAEARLAQIMGRPQPAEPPPEQPVPQAAVPPSAQEPSPPAVEEAFGWTAFAPLEAPPGDMPEEAAERVVEEAVASRVDEVLDWASFAQPEPPSEPAVPAEAAAPVAPPREAGAPAEQVEAPSAAEPPAAEDLFSVEEAVAPPAAAPVAEELVQGAPEVLTPAGVIEEVPRMPEREMPKPVERAAPPPKAPAAEAAPDAFAAERAYLKEHPRDHQARLALARGLWQVGRKGEALEAYGRVIRAGKFLDAVIAELEEYLEQWPEVTTQRVLGDAYMKGGKLDKALELYRGALETL